MAYRPPYDWLHLHAFLAERAIEGLEIVDQRGYSRVVRAQDGYALLGVRPAEGADALELRVSGATPCDLLPLLSSVRRMFDLAADPQRLAFAFNSDSDLRPLVALRPGLRIPGSWDPFECGVSAILESRMRPAAARSALGRLVRHLGHPIELPVSGLSHLFPTPTAIADADMQACGLNSSCCSALRSFARAVCDRAVDFDDASENVVDALTALPGAGQWVAGYVALRGLGELDAFPHGDRVLRRQFSPAQVLITARELNERAEAWRPFRGYAVLHLWQANATAHQARPSFEVRKQPVQAYPWA